MNWNDEIRNITIGTLFAFFGKALVAVALWYLMALIPIIVIFAIIS